MKTKLFFLFALMLLLVLAACGPTPVPPTAPTITLRPESTTVYFGSCDPHTLHIEATVHGDASAVSYLDFGWSFSLPDGTLTPGANGASPVPMALASPGVYQYSQDLGAGPGWGSDDFIVNVTVRALNTAGSVIATASLAGIQWLPCPPPPSGSSSLLILARAHPFTVTYDHASLCLSYVPNSTVTFTAYVYEPGLEITHVQIASQLMMVPSVSGVAPFTPPVFALAPVGEVDPSGGRVYQETLDVNTLSPDAYLAGASGFLQWTAQGLNSRGEVVAQNGPNGLWLQPCGPGGSANSAADASNDPTPTSPVPDNATVTPSVPRLTFLTAANCRKGPGTAYDIVTSFDQGKSLEIAGRSDQGKWWLVNMPDGGSCWVAGSTVKTEGVADQASVVPAPVLPDMPAKLDAPYTCNVKLVTMPVDLSWGVVSGASGYHVIRSGALLATVTGTTSYHDEAPLGMDLVYEVEAYNTYGVGPRVSVTIPACK